jgi:hypothetical protein
MIGLGDELHVAVLDAVVHHLHVVPGAAIADPLAAGLAIDLRGDALQDRSHRGPGVARTAGHDRWPVARPFLPAGDAAADKVHAVLGELPHAPFAVREQGVAAVDNDVTGR